MGIDSSILFSVDNLRIVVGEVKTFGCFVFIKRSLLKLLSI